MQSESNQVIWFCLCRWSGADKKLEEDFLPQEKQFLITERVPCARRVDDLETNANKVQEFALDDEWTEVKNENGEAGEVVDVDMEEEKKDEGQAKADEGESSEELDIDDAMNAMQAAASSGGGQGAAQTDNIFAGMVSESKGSTGGQNDAIKKVRMYDLSITYDLWTQTPRLWLQGYSEEGDLLTQEEMFQDIMADYAKKTVTYEKHERTGS